MDFDFEELIEIERPTRGRPSAERLAASRGKRACRDYVDETVCTYDDLCAWNKKTGCVSRPFRTAAKKAGAKKGVQPAGLAKYQAELAALKKGGLSHKDAQAALRAKKQRGGWF